VRRIPRLPEAETILNEQRLAPCGRGELHLPHGDGTEDEPLELLQPDVVPAREAAGLPGLKFHDLRHTFASLMIAARVHPRVLKLMSHESIQITMDKYGHLFEDAVEHAMELLDEYLARIDVSAAPSLPMGRRRRGRIH
jgi:integrase